MKNTFKEERRSSGDTVSNSSIGVSCLRNFETLLEPTNAGEDERELLALFVIQKLQSMRFSTDGPRYKLAGRAMLY
jgi:hypothetical protein